MAGKNNDQSSRIKSFFENEIFIDELSKIKQKVGDEDNCDIEVIKLRKRWKLNWDYHETIVNYIESGQIDYDLGDNDIRVIDYKSKTILPSDAPEEEFRVMEALKDYKKNGVYIKLPKDVDQTKLLNFVRENYILIDDALNSNFTGRLTNQYPELLTRRRVEIYRLYEKGRTTAEIASDLKLDPREVRRIIKEFKERISS